MSLETTTGEVVLMEFCLDDDDDVIEGKGELSVKVKVIIEVRYLLY